MRGVRRLFAACWLGLSVSVTISGRSWCRTPTYVEGLQPSKEASRAVGKRWTWVAWSMLAVFAVSLVVGTILAVANGTFQQDAVNQVLLLLGFSALRLSGP